MNFDGTNDYLNSGAALTGAVDNGNFTVSMWIKSGIDAVARHLLDANVSVERISLDATNVVNLDFRTSGGTTVGAFGTGTKFTVAAGWLHLLGSYQSSTQTLHVYVNDAIETLAYSVKNTGNIDWTGNTDWILGALNGGTQKFDGDISEVWIDNSYLDLSVVANRRKFIDASGKPVDLGSDGSTPTGTSPLIYLSGDTSTWHTNKGTGGGFTENGALTTATTSPSD